jgi:CheY-like chemotaxis protein
MSDGGNRGPRFRLVPSENALLLSDPGALCILAPVFMSKVALVVDDSMLIRYTVCRFLEQRGFAVESAANGAEALDVLRHVRADLIVTDMQMPKMSGSELITALKGKPETAGIPIIIVAVRASGFDKSEKRANFAIYKDIDIDAQLAQALDAVLGKASREHAAGK